jgi:glycosyltransferase involved in cell wall biosynthesis
MVGTNPVNSSNLIANTQENPPIISRSKLARVVIVQHAGDYREAVVRLANSGSENYYAQKYSVDAVAEVAQRVETTTVICCMSSEVYNEVLDNGVRAIGAGFSDRVNVKALITLIEAQKPTHLILRTPILQVIQWASKQNIKILLTLADSFSAKGLRNKVKNFLLANALNDNRVDWVCNHGINSSLSLKQIGVSAKKIVPWDWPAVVTPDPFKSKSFPSDTRNLTLLYVGAVIKEKGVGDVIAAIAKLKAANVQINLKVAGKGESAQFIHQVKQLGIEDQVEFLGMVPHNDIIQLLSRADLVVVPSHHEYPEGFPMTIYETLCTRTPILASDHPMFRTILKHGQNSMIFPAGNADDLTACIQTLLSDPALYEKISLEASNTWQKLQIPVKWANLVHTWLFNPSGNQQWLLENSLSSYLRGVAH